ncbi:MAG: hypothetical protein JNJ60_05500 [Rhodocyclaceae bacterium]|nr:hypothetical protein [Rhodocyclaceae bacterium]
MRLVLLLLVVALVGYLTLTQMRATTAPASPAGAAAPAPADLKKLEQDLNRAADEAAAEQRRKLDEATR